MTATLPETLNRARDLVWPALRAAVDTLEPDLRAVAVHHFGWDDGRRGWRQGGASRPGPASAAAAAAPPRRRSRRGRGRAGAQLLAAARRHHGWRPERRHRPTVWIVFGEARAILAGDALALANQVLLRRETPEAMRATALLVDATARLIGGQSEDIGVRGTPT